MPPVPETFAHDASPPIVFADDDHHE